MFFGMIKREPVPLAVQSICQSLSFKETAASDSIDFPIRKSFFGFKRFLILAVNYIQAPLISQFVSILNHFRNFIRSINVNQRKRHVPQKSFSGKPEKNCTVFADRPKHAQTGKSRISFS